MSGDAWAPILTSTERWTLQTCQLESMHSRAQTQWVSCASLRRATHHCCFTPKILNFSTLSLRVDATQRFECTSWSNPALQTSFLCTTVSQRCNKLQQDKYGRFERETTFRRISVPNNLSRCYQSVPIPVHPLRLCGRYAALAASYSCIACAPRSRDTSY